MPLDEFRDPLARALEVLFTTESQRHREEKLKRIAVFRGPDFAARVFACPAVVVPPIGLRAEQQATMPVLSPWIVFVTDNLQARDNSLTTSHSQSP